ncbi:uncharacterized protein I303_104445 [Kwoniella dejecticola CBS 10117]|uniref:Uncharacterized protein n=1 Tax=Kwoniella dejecticola CBS 10117 TaxID=1296121 RepID=A0A1A6A5B9_9TREE|nr:uncharacterized protein I303_04576 [Kwoniella dejecticola CBS 10117]OBR85243.1 hypothetical protein I303_04576 [Kwoniella dejecticola CBS 10117]
MSLSSATTLISPTSTKAATPSATAGASSSSHAHHPQRRSSVHSAHGMKRKPSTHSAHGHHGHSNRRSSEGEHGRRALAAGLAMHALDTTDAVVKKKKEKRPLPKNSRSDTHLPRLSRTTSITSNTSHDSHGRRPSRGGHKRSEESISIVQDDGKEVEVPGADDGEEEGWESGDGGGDQLEISPEKSKRGKSRADSSQQARKGSTSSGMRRTVSDTSAEPPKSNDPIISEILDTKKKVITPLDAPHPPALTQRTTGFAGTTQQPDPSVPAQEPHPVVTPGPIRRNTSAKSLVGPVAMESTTSTDSAPPQTSNRPPSTDRAGSKDRSRPDASIRVRSTEGSGLPKAETSEPSDKVSTSPSYPFPQMPSDPALQGPGPGQGSSQGKSQQATESRQRHASQAAPAQSSGSGSGSGSGPARSRQTSQQHPQLRHRYSNSSLRSIQSLRAPPHPLNSPTGYRTQPTTATSRPGSMFGSPTKADARQRVSSMHHPPVPQPQVSYEMAKGQGWDGPIPEEDIPRNLSNSNTKNSRMNSNYASTSSSTANANSGRPQSTRKDSISSMRSIFAPLTAPTLSSPARSNSGQGGRRKTALEAAAQASKMSSTTDPTTYHNSLGHANIPETVYLISRFLPSNKKARRPRWEMNPADLQNQNQNLPENEHENEHGEGEGGMRVGLTNGDYRESHESLVKTLKDLSLSSANGDQQRRGGGGLNRTYSSSMTYNNLLSPSTGLGVGEEGSGVGGIIKTTKEGYGLVVKKGQGGRTPFEMSVQRCLAQRPGGGTGLGF